jgi:hypothetical protein
MDFNLYWSCAFTISGALRTIARKRSVFVEACESAAIALSCMLVDFADSPACIVADEWREPKMLRDSAGALKPENGSTELQKYFSNRESRYGRNVPRNTGGVPRNIASVPASHVPTSQPAFLDNRRSFACRKTS